MKFFSCLKCNQEFKKNTIFGTKFNLCILHSLNKNKDKFWQQIQNDLNLKYTCERGQEELDHYYIQYNSIVFPKFQKDYEDDRYDATSEISNFYFLHESYLNHDCEQSPEGYYVDKLIEKCHIEFNNCTFLDEVNLQRYEFKESVIFNNCTFEKEVHLNDSLNAYIEFRSCDFKDQKLKLNDKTFYKLFHLIDCNNIALLNMENINFMDSASFSQSNLKKVKFNEARFGGMAIFVKTHFYEDTKFNYCLFEENVFFNEAIVHKTIDLKNAIFKKEVNFLDMKNENENVLKAKNIENRETARIIKHSFEKQDNIIEANKFYALEMHKRDEELSEIKKDNFKDWIVFKLHKISSNHSQDWVLVLLWIINISYVYKFLKDGFVYLPDRVLFAGLFVAFISMFILICKKFLFIKKLNCITTAHFITMMLFLLYSSMTLDNISNLINPFSIMTTETITIDLLIFKSAVVYLIYQFIVSIKQNTRRK
ncbi:pentapeptide repeat-containing protein [Sulfurimonas sp.]|uniref:pentapeptide repeat-containing protein n=1 Tax=Sulfurimonas sp. TaxID=2022749 RepID=UPI001A037692|nr:pentapeptide repeat-containing protein [Sulfurimonas sp.]MBE0514040.1 pentapeptide repeat-containing protein [Sulfurimonas sp.]